MATAEPPETAPRDRRATAVEIALVIGIPGTLLIALSFAELKERAGGAIRFDDRSLVIQTAQQLAVLAVVAPCLHRRGWRLRDMTAPAGLLDLSRTTYLFLGTLAAGYASFTATWLVATPLAEVAAAQVFSGRISPWVNLLASAVNPVFEEFLYLGYGYTALARRAPPWAAAFLSLWLRTAVHAYQGKLAFVSILPIGVVFTAYYLRTGRFWPVILAHALLDYVGLATLEDSPAG